MSKEKFVFYPTSVIVDVFFGRNPIFIQPEEDAKFTKHLWHASVYDTFEEAKDAAYHVLQKQITETLKRLNEIKEPRQPYEAEGPRKS